MKNIDRTSAMRWMVGILSLFSACDALGLTVEPVPNGQASRLSSPKNPANCLSYPTVKDDLIMVDVNVREKLVSQSLNLRIFDDEDNQIRHQKNIEGELTVIFSNLNNPKSDSNHLFNVFKRSNNFKFPNIDRFKAHDLVNSDKGKSLIYICFDNVYMDMSWTFHPQPYDVELFVDIKDKDTIKLTNYNNFNQYFSKIKHEEEKKSGKDSTDIENKKELTEESFDSLIDYLKAELQQISITVDNSETLLTELLNDETKLRDTNEEILSMYTIVSVAIISCVSIFGIGQLIYFKYYLKKRKIL